MLYLEYDLMFIIVTCQCNHCMCFHSLCI